MVTTICGDVNENDVETWETSLQHALNEIPSDSEFKIFVNLFGFKAVNLDAHKRFRTIVPATLADFGWKVGYVNLFDEATEMQIQNVRGIQCIAVAHVHQDETKIALYDQKFGSDVEHFFTDPAKGYQWIESV